METVLASIDIDRGEAGRFVSRGFQTELDRIRPLAFASVYTLESICRFDYVAINTP